MPNPTTLEIDLLAYGDLAVWSPQVGDVIHKDGIFNRWVGVVTDVKGTNLIIRKAGSPRSLCTGDFKEEKIAVPMVKSSFIGSYYVNSRGTYYV